ncbi:uncharacterized protein LOC135207566 isoform X1 [Macrobrachium nipponense]|uniref:uncharacterized protein LOC135207566 isoform X1 n=1 Tax=Macrobrachium nipponense TaxID=159736 RepID=UPI0030C899B4
MCLIARGINAGIIYHSPRFQCIPPSVQLWQPTIYNIPGRILCANTCSQKRCFFYEVSATNGPCKIYGIGMESTNYYVRIDAATLPPGGPLQEKARYRPTYPLSSLALSSNAVDDDVPSFWENGLLNPWWMVDLGAYYMIHYVNILPRQGYYTYRFQSVEVIRLVEQKTKSSVIARRSESPHRSHHGCCWLSRGTISVLWHEAEKLRFLNMCLKEHLRPEVLWFSSLITVTEKFALVLLHPRQPHSSCYRRLLEKDKCLLSPEFTMS